MSELLIKPTLALLALARRLTGLEYEAYRIVICPAVPGGFTDPAVVATVEEERDGEVLALRAELIEDGEVVSHVRVWSGEVALRFRDYFEYPPATGEMGNLETPPRFRGRGYAKRLQSSMPAVIAAAGWGRVYGRIWHSNAASVVVQRRAGWEIYGVRFDVRLFGRARRFMLGADYPRAFGPPG